MGWTKPRIRRHFYLLGEDEEGRKRCMITLQITNKDPEHSIAVIHLPFEQEGWHIEKPEKDYLEAAVEGLTVAEEGERWQCATFLGEELVGKRRGLVFHAGNDMEGKWESYLEFGQTATVTFEALIISGTSLVEQTLTLRYFPALSWKPHRDIPKYWLPELSPSPYYSSNEELEKGHLA